MNLRLSRHFTIFTRIYLFGVALLFAFMLGIFAMLLIFVEPANDAEMQRIGSWVAHNIAAENDSAKRRHVLDSLRDDARVALTLYDGFGARIDANTKVHPQTLPTALIGRLRSARTVTVEEGQRSLLLVRTATPQRPTVMLEMIETKSFVLGGWTLVSLLTVLALIAWPIARSLTVPIRQLQTTMTSFGHGDVGARVSLEGTDEISQLARAFNVMAERISRLLQTERLLMAGVAHELRTPLQRIRVALELAADEGGEASRQQRYIESISTDLVDLDRIVTDILTVSALEISRADTSGQELLKRREPVNAARLIRDCAERFEAAHPQRELALHIDGLLPDIQVEPRLIHRAINNLLENAHRYAPPETTVELSAECREGRIGIAVRDHGPGIGPEHLPHLFSPFYRADEARARSSGGAGLGLTIVKAIVEAHRGTVTVASEPGAGACFRIRLPADPPQV